MPRAKRTQAGARPLRGSEDDAAGERVATRHDTGDSVSQANGMSVERPHGGADHDIEQKANHDPRICRLSWPSDPRQRRAELVKILPQAIREYFGNEAVIEYRLSLQEGELAAVAAEQPEIAAALAKAKDLLCALAEDCLAVSIVTDKSSAGARYLLERLYPEKYAKKSVNEKGNGRSYDTPAEGLKSVLDEIKTKPQTEVQ